MINNLIKNTFIQKNLQKKIIYNIDTLILWNLILGCFIKGGKKYLSYYFLINMLFFIKKEKKKNPILILKLRLDVIKPDILLYNKRKGSIMYELPRFLSIEKSIQKSVEWLIKLTKKRKKNTLNMLLLELENIKGNKGDILKKKKNIVLIAAKNKPFFYLLK